MSRFPAHNYITCLESYNNYYSEEEGTKDRSHGTVKRALQQHASQAILELFYSITLKCYTPLQVIDKKIFERK